MSFIYGKKSRKEQTLAYTLSFDLKNNWQKLHKKLKNVRIIFLLKLFFLFEWVNTDVFSSMGTYGINSNLIFQGEVKPFSGVPTATPHRLRKKQLHSGPAEMLF